MNELLKLDESRYKEQPALRQALFEIFTLRVLSSQRHGAHKEHSQEPKAEKSNFRFSSVYSVPL
jgi:hypothetical protein